MENDHKHDLVAILEAGLESYADAEPGLGLEKRIMNRAFARNERRKFAWWAAATACACLLLAVVFDLSVHLRPSHGVQSTTAQTVPRRVPLVDSPQINTPHLKGETGQLEANINAANAPQIRAAHARGGNTLAVKQSQPKPEKLPKLDVFPTPHPLTPEERALVAFVNQHPKEVQKLIDAERRNSEPIQIAAIHIEPLEIDGAQQERETNAKDQ